MDQKISGRTIETYKAWNRSKADAPDDIDTYDPWGAAIWLDAHGVCCGELESLEEITILMKRKRNKRKDNKISYIGEADQVLKSVLERKWSLYNALLAALAENEKQIHFSFHWNVEGESYEEAKSSSIKYKQLMNDCHIIVAGQTKSGKSSLLNLLFGTDIVPESLLFATSTMFCVHSSSTKKLEVEERDGKRTVVDINEVTVADLKDTLTYYITYAKKIDLYWPILKFQGFVTFMDAPGIEEGLETTERVLEYVSKAILLILVIDSSKVEHMQYEQLSYLLKRHLGSRSYLKPSNVIFLCNKWDKVEDCREETSVWKEIMNRLKKAFPGMREENVIRMSITKAKRWVRAGLGTTSDYQVLQKCIESVLQSSFNTMHVQCVNILRWPLMISSRNRTIAVPNKQMQERLLLQPLKKLKDTVTRKVEFHCKKLSKALYCHLESAEVASRRLEWYHDNVPDVIEWDNDVTLCNMMNSIFSRITQDILAWEINFGYVLDAENSLNHTVQTEISCLKQPLSRNISSDPEESSDMVIDVPHSGLLHLANVVKEFLCQTTEVVMKQLFTRYIERKYVVSNMQYLTSEIIQDHLKEANLNKYVLERYFNSTVQIYEEHFESLRKQFTEKEKGISHFIIDLVTEGFCMTVKDILDILDTDMQTVYIEHDNIEFVCDFEPSYNFDLSICECINETRRRVIVNDVCITALRMAGKLCSLRHKNIIQIYGISLKPRHYVAVVHEYCSESLQTMVQSDKRLHCSQATSDEERRFAVRFFTSMAMGICDGLQFLHDNGIRMWSLTLTTVLVNKSVPKLGVSLWPRGLSSCRGDDMKELGVLLVDLWHGGFLQKRRSSVCSFIEHSDYIKDINKYQTMPTALKHLAERLVTGSGFFHRASVVRTEIMRINDIHQSESVKKPNELLDYA